MLQSAVSAKQAIHTTDLNGVHVHSLADLALQPQNNLLGGLGLLVENGLCLTTIARLLAVIPSLSCNNNYPSESGPCS